MPIGTMTDVGGGLMNVVRRANKKALPNVLLRKFCTRNLPAQTREHFLEATPSLQKCSLVRVRWARQDLQIIVLERPSTHLPLNARACCIGILEVQKKTLIQLGIRGFGRGS